MAGTPLKNIYSSGNYVGVKIWSEFIMAETTPAPTGPLLARLQEDMKAAMRAGQKDRLNVIRMLISDVKIIDMAPKPTTEEQAIEAYAKKLRKSLEEYDKLGRTTEASALKFEIGVVEEYSQRKPQPKTPPNSSRPSLPLTPSPPRTPVRRSGCS